VHGMGRARERHRTGAMKISDVMLAKLLRARLVT